MDIEGLREAIKRGNFEWRKHALIRIAERNISQDVIIEVILSGEVIENYPEEMSFSSCLIFKMKEAIPYHVVISFDSQDKKAYIITAYNPSLDKFEPDFRTRRR